MTAVLSETERAVLRDKVARARLAEEGERKKRVVPLGSSAREGLFSPEDALLAAVLRLSDEERETHLRRIERENRPPEDSSPRTDRLTGRPSGSVVNPSTDRRLAIDLPGAKAEPLDAPWHGSLNGYCAKLCRCFECREVHRDYQREYRARKREEAAA